MEYGNGPDHSFYTKRMIEEALWLQPYFRWTLQDAVDLVVTFCKQNGLHWSDGRARKQIDDAQRYVHTKRSQKDLHQPAHTLTGNDEE